MMRLVHQDGYNLKTLGSVLTLAPCWIVKGSPAETRDNCVVFIHGDYPCWSKPEKTYSDVPCQQGVYFNHFHRVKEQQCTESQKGLPERGGWVRRG